MTTTEEERAGVTVGVRFSGDLHKELKQIAEQSGLQMTVLIRLGVERLVAEVKETGRVPVPPVSIKKEGDAE